MRMSGILRIVTVPEMRSQEPNGDRDESPREPESGTAKLGLPRKDESGTAKLEMQGGSDTAELELPGWDESGTAEPEHTQPTPHDQIPIPHQSQTQGTEDLQSYPSNYKGC